MNDRHHHANGRVTPRAAHEDELPSLRRRSPAVYWTAVLVLVAMAAGAIATLVSSLAW